MGDQWERREGERGEIHVGGRREVGVGLGYHRPRGGENRAGQWGRVSGVNNEVGLSSSQLP